MKILAVTDREYSSIIAGLRLLQQEARLLGNPHETYVNPMVADVASNGHAFAPLSLVEIERLIEKSHEKPHP